MNFRRVGMWAGVYALIGIACAAHGQTMLKVTAGWGDAMRLGRWTPIFISVADPVTRDVDLQIHGTYGEKSLAFLVHQTAVAQPRPTTYALLYPVNAQPSQIEVIVSDSKSGRTLAAQGLQNPASFSPAGHVPKKLLGPQDFLVGISGEIGDAMLLEAQLGEGELAAGILDLIRLPANSVGYDGISVLILAAADLSELKPEQEEAMVQWVREGGNLVVIPGTSVLPTSSVLVDALPCTIGENRTIDRLNGRALLPRSGAAAVRVMDQVGYEGAVGLGHIAVLPMDVSAVRFGNAEKANGFWQSILGGMTKVAGIAQTTEMPLSEEQDVLIPGPNAADSVGRGARESVAIRHVLQLLGATGSEARADWQKFFLVMAGLFFLVGPVDSVLLMRLGQRPRNWVTVAGWIGLLVSVGAWAADRPRERPPEVSGLRVVDQVGDRLVGATDIVAVKSERSEKVPVPFDGEEWWEPANQAERLFGVDRFVDAWCAEDREGCVPGEMRLVGGEAQAWHGEKGLAGRGVLRAKLGVTRDGHLVGTLTNLGDKVCSDFWVETAIGNFRVGGLLAGGGSMGVDVVAGREGIVMGALPVDVGDVAVDRADAVERLVKGGHGCVYCQVMVGDGRHWEVVRAVVELGK